MLRDYLKLHFIVLLWGFTAILGKMLTVPPVELVFWRTLLAAAGLARQLQAQVVGASVLIELGLLGGRARWDSDAPLHAALVA